MSDRRLQVFHAVAQLLSFTKAAEKLGLTQPATTFQIRQLENQFDIRLFDRSHNRVSLTEAGDIVLEYADKIFRTYDEMEEALRNFDGKSQVTIGVSDFVDSYYPWLMPEGVSSTVSTTPIGTFFITENQQTDMVLETAIPITWVTCNQSSTDQVFTNFEKKLFHKAGGISLEKARTLALGGKKVNLPVVVTGHSLQSGLDIVENQDLNSYVYVYRNVASLKGNEQEVLDIIKERGE